MNKFRSALMGLTVLTVLSVASSALALNAQHLRPNTGAVKGFQVHTSDMMEPWQFSLGLVTNYARNPLEFVPVVGSDSPILRHLITTDFIGEIGITDWLMFTVDMPLHLLYDIDTTPVSTASVGGGAAGDLSVTPKVQIFDAEETEYGLGLAVVGRVRVPTGAESKFVGDSTANGSVQAVGDWQIQSNRFAVNAGFRWRDREALPAGVLTVDEEILYGAGFHRPIAPDWGLNIGVEVFGTVNLAQNSVQAGLPLEGIILFQKRWREDQSIAMTAGGGIGLVQGYGTPEARGFIGLAYVRPMEEEEEVIEVKAAPLPAKIVNDKIVISEQVHFEFNKASIRPESFPILDAVVIVMNQNPKIKLLEVQGHTDSVGADTYNQRLSEKRAKSVMEYLAKNGVARERLTSKGYGEANPIATNDTDEGRAQNRRTEFIILEKD